MPVGLHAVGWLYTAPGTALREWHGVPGWLAASNGLGALVCCSLYTCVFRMGLRLVLIRCKLQRFAWAAWGGLPYLVWSWWRMGFSHLEPRLCLFSPTHHLDACGRMCSVLNLRLFSIWRCCRMQAARGC